MLFRWVGPSMEKNEFVILHCEHKLVRKNKEIRTDQYNTMEGHVPQMEW